jgi:protein-disulfide isomerase
MKNLPLLLGTIFGTLILIVGVAFFFSGSSAPTDQNAAPVDQAVLMDGATNIKGKPDAQITVVEFSDFQCHACKGYQPTVDQLSKQYPDTVKIVYRHFPLDEIHPNARLAAQAAEAAQEMGKFWEMHDKLFATQSDWEKIADKKQLLEKFSQYATELKIDKQEFLAKIESESVIEKVTKDKELGNSLTVQATPTFFVNGVKTAAPQLLTTVESLQTKK